MDSKVSTQAYIKYGTHDSWSGADEDTVQAPVEMPPLEDASIPDPLASRADIEATQNQATEEETETQGN